MTKIACDKLRTFLIAVFIKKGMYAFEAELAADRLLDADRLGKTSEGCASLPGHVVSLNAGDVDPRAVSAQKSETAAISFIDANEGLGHVAATKGMELAVEKAKELGVAIVLISNSQRLGSPLVYAQLAATQGMLGVCVTSTASASSVEAFGSEKPIFGRQPFAYALPFQDNTVGFEFSFEAGQESEIFIPPELSGPFGLFHAVLTCGLTGQKMPVEKKRGPAFERTEHLLMAINPACFAGTETLKKKLSDLGAEIGHHGKTLNCYEQGTEKEIELSTETIDTLKQLAQKEKIEWLVD